MTRSRARTAAINQLAAMLDAHWPGPRDLFCSLASQIALAFLTDYPTPDAAARLGEARMAAFCRRHSYRGGKSPAELLARLRAAPTAPVGLPADHAGSHHRRPGRSCCARCTAGITDTRGS